MLLKMLVVAYDDLKRKYDPSFNTSVHAYKKYREILKAYENVKDEQRRKMYDLKDNENRIEVEKKCFELYDFVKQETSFKESVVDYSKVEEYSASGYKDIEIKVPLSYLYYLLNLRCDLSYVRKVRCDNCSSFVPCDTCDGKKVVEYKEHFIYCPVCGGEGKVSVNCRACGDSGFKDQSKEISFYVDGEHKEFKGYGDEYSNSLKSDLHILFDFYDKDYVTVNENVIEVDYYLSKKETIEGVNKEYFSEFGAFKLIVPCFVEAGYIQEIEFNNKKIIFKFYNEKYDGEDVEKYLFINKSNRGKYIYFSEDYCDCSLEENSECCVMVKCDDKIVIPGKGQIGKYGGDNGDLIINTEFNNGDSLLYTDQVKVVETSKFFNLLGGREDGVFHYGLRKQNVLIKKDDFYYLLRGNSEKKRKLKDYFLFKIVSLILWFLIPSLMIIMPYNRIMFAALIATLIGYMIAINAVMEVEV